MLKLVFPKQDMGDIPKVTFHVYIFPSKYPKWHSTQKGKVAFPNVGTFFEKDFF